jgi:hypothetical protein
VTGGKIDPCTRAGRPCHDLTVVRLLRVLREVSASFALNLIGWIEQLVIGIQPANWDAPRDEVRSIRLHGRDARATISRYSDCFAFSARSPRPSR